MKKSEIYIERLRTLNRTLMYFGEHLREYTSEDSNASVMEVNDIIRLVMDCVEYRYMLDRATGCDDQYVSKYYRGLLEGSKRKLEVRIREF